jgi:hypothetical protein
MYNFRVSLGNELQLNTGNSLSTITSLNGVDVKLADTSLSTSVLGKQVSTTYKSDYNK